jgi:hypothetical protein
MPRHGRQAQHPTQADLRDEEGGTGFSLCFQRVELLVEAFFCKPRSADEAAPGIERGEMQR